MENWLPYIVNSFIDKRLSNGFTEGLNNKIKVIKRVGFGYKNFDFLDWDWCIFWIVKIQKKCHPVKIKNVKIRKTRN